MKVSDADVRFMREAIDEAAAAMGRTSPNPHVGAILVCRDEAAADHAGARIVGRGHHRMAGSAHAEVEALRDWGASDRRGPATLYVNLEPCNHHGRTKPCTEAILQAPVERVVVGMLDPDPRVRGRGIERLRQSGLEVELGLLPRACYEVNHEFVARQSRGRPFVALKVALSADDCIARGDGSPVSITGPATRRFVHGLRARYDAILVGVETIRCDRPRLDDRHSGAASQPPRRFILDPDLRLRPEWLPLAALPAVVFHLAGAVSEGGPPDWGGKVETVPLPAAQHHPRHFDLAELLRQIEKRDCWSVLVEGGGETHRRFLEADLWDRLYLLRNPDLRLGGKVWAAGPAWSKAASKSVQWERFASDGDQVAVYVHPDSGVEDGR